MFKEFIDNDPRKDRDYITVTDESLTKRCESMLPPHLILGKTILDVGCSLGAMGRWSFEHGCLSYEGVEIQDGYRDKAKQLLSNYPQSQFYKFIGEVDKTYDIVIAAGILNSIDDQMGFIRNLCSKSNDYIIIEMPYLPSNDAIIHLCTTGKMINYHDVNNPYVGISFVPSILALTHMLAICGFQVDKRIFPEKIIGSHDPYNDLNKNYPRCILQFRKSKLKINSLEDVVRNNNVGV